MTLTRTTRTRNKSALTIDPHLERQARRIAKQSKHINQEIVTKLDSELPITLTSAKSRAITLKSLKKLKPLTDTQAKFFDAYESGGEDNIGYILSGSAGCGKTYLSMYFALGDILMPDSIYKKLIIIRGTTQTKDIGALPGDVELKISKFSDPYIDACAELLGRSDAFEKLVDMGKVEFMCSSFLRGRNFDNCIIYADEFSSLTWHEMNTICTRVGKDCKIIISGDIAQNDLIYSRNEKSGWNDFIRVSDKLYEFQRFEFTAKDIVRSGFVRSWITACGSVGL